MKELWDKWEKLLGAPRASGSFQGATGTLESGGWLGFCLFKAGDL